MMFIPRCVELVAVPYLPDLLLKQCYINNKVYDLSGFKHPGGPVALEVAKNRDASFPAGSKNFTKDSLLIKIQRNP